MMRAEPVDIAIIGGGIVGLATGYALRQARPDDSILVLEKEPAPAQHQTGRNSGVIHSGLYYRPGSEKARTCTLGRSLLIDFAKQHHIRHDLCGKIVVANSEKDLPQLDRIAANGTANGLSGIERISAEEIQEREPACRGLAGLWIPQTGIIDFVGVANKLAELIRLPSGDPALLCNRRVVKIV